MCKPLRKVKKTVTTLTFLMLVIFLLPIAASAADTGVEKITSDDFAVEISDETSKILESMGIENIDYDSLISASPRKIITCIIDIAKGKLKEPVKTLGIVLSIAVVAAVVGSFAPSKTAEKYSVGTVCSFLIVSALTVPLASTLSSAASSIALTADFMKGYIPVFAGTVAASGMTLTSASYSALELAAAEAVSQLSSMFFVPLTGLIMMVTLLSSVSDNVNSAKIISLLKKIISIVLGVLSTVFVGLVTIKGALASSADSVSVKGIKLLAGNTIPIVGGAIGDAYTSVLGSLNLIKGTVGAFGIFAIAAVNIPVITEMLLWMIAVNICSALCGLLGEENAAKVLDGVSGVLSLTNTITVFSAVVFILSTGIILSLRS